MEEKIKELLLNELSEAYCYNYGTIECDDCHRKYQNWSLLSDVAEKLSKEILKIINNNPKIFINGEEYNKEATYDAE